MKNIPLLAKIIIIAVILIILLAIIVFGKLSYEQSKMTPLETGEVITGVYAINNGFVNCYLVKGDDGYLLIDAGNKKSQTETALQELGLSPEEITDILLTHSDSDHTAALSLFPNARLYLPETETQMIDGTTKRNFFMRNQLDREYQSLKDEEVISIGGYSIQCIATPGHTPGSMSFLFDDQYLFVGDTMSLQNGKADLFSSFYNMDDDTQESSISKLAEIQTQYIFTGHHGYTDNPVGAFNSFN